MVSVRRVFENVSVDEVEKKLRQELEKRGYKPILELTPSDIVKDKLGNDIDRYRILYICNPADFYNMVQKNYDIGSFAPCPVLIYEKEDKIYFFKCIRRSSSYHGGTI